MTSLVTLQGQYIKHKIVLCDSWRLLPFKCPTEVSILFKINTNGKKCNLMLVKSSLK